MPDEVRDGRNVALNIKCWCARSSKGTILLSLDIIGFGTVYQCVHKPQTTSILNVMQHTSALIQNQDTCKLFLPKSFIAGRTTLCVELRNCMTLFMVLINVCNGTHYHIISRCKL